jgi:hypothetical protein
VLLTVKGSAPGDALIKVQNTGSGSYSGLEFHNAGGTPGFFFGVDNSNNSTRLNSFNSFPFLLLTNSVERIRITPGGDVGIGTNAPSSLLHVNGAVTATQFITSSSRRLKQGFDKVDGRDVLERLATVPITRWTFAADTEGQPHIGPTAEDFQSAFGLGQVGDGLSLADLNGVALAAIQALYDELQEQRKVSAAQQELIDEQRAVLEELRQRRQADGTRDQQ